MSTKHHILPNEIQRLQQEAVKRATDSVGGPVGLYEEWPDEEPTLIVTEDTGKLGRAFCHAVWEDKEGKEKCMLDHQYRAHFSGMSPISECWLGVHNVVCHIKDKSSVTLLGGAFRIQEFKNSAESKLNNYINKMPKEKQERFISLWNDVPEFSEDFAIKIISKHLELAASWYLFMITELSRFRYEENQVSHDLLIFLQSLIGNIDTLAVEMRRSPHIGKKWDSRFEEILRQCESYSRYLGTRLGNLGEPEFIYHLVKDVIYESVELHKSKAKRKWIDLRVELENATDNKGQVHYLEIQMAKDYLSRAFHNILDNAIKYSYNGTAENPRRVEIVGKFYNKNNIPGYLIKVSNYGIGIEKDETEKVFEIGYQGRLRSGEMRPGFGVGLSFVKECIGLHSGSISIESRRLSDGHAWLTTISIWLPLYVPKPSPK